MNINTILALLLCFILTYINKINIYFVISLLIILILFNIFGKDIYIINDGNLFLLLCLSILIYFLYV